MKKQLFVPATKVQKDRLSMRETDERMAKFGRYGLVLNLAAYLLCVVMGYMRIIAPTLTVVLTAGILLITVVRAYYLFRFEALYARAPTRWRNSYFVVTLLGAVWWSVILVSFTAVLGMVAEVPMLWFYTIIFFSTTAYAFSPFRLFCQIYQIVALVPVGLTAAWIGGLDGYMYATMMLVFVLLLNLQTHTMSTSYWQRLEANFILKQKAKDLEIQQRNTEASIVLNNEFLANLSQEFRTSLNDVLGGLSLLQNTPLTKEQQDFLLITQQAGSRQLDLVANIMDFARISNHQLALDQHTFSLRPQLEKWITAHAAEAHQQAVELDYVVDEDLPQRVRGDDKRLQQVFTTILSHMIKRSERGYILVEARFEREEERRGLLKLSVTDSVNTIGGSEVLFTALTDAEITRQGRGLWLSICRGLVECMGGNMGIIDDPEKGHCLWLHLPLEVVNKQPTTIAANARLHGKRALLMTDGSSVLHNLQRDLQSWSVLYEMTTDTDKAIQRLDEAIACERPFDVVIVALPSNALEGFLFSTCLLNDARLSALPQLILCAHSDPHLTNYQALTEVTPHLQLLFRPVISHELHDALCALLLDISAATNKEAGGITEAMLDQPSGRGRSVLLVEDHRVNQMVAESMLKKLGYRVLLAGNGRDALACYEAGNIDLILMDCQMPEMDGFEATKAIRLREEADGGVRRLPILAMTAHAGEGDEALCLASGMDDYLVKPVSYADLQACLTRWLGA